MYKNMTLRKILIYLFLIVMLSATKIGCKESNKVNHILSELKKFNFSIYPGANNKKIFSLKNGYIRGVSYNVRMYYPAEKILDFYEAEMAKIGFKPFVEEYYKYGDRNWQHFVDETRENKPYTAQLIADWADTLKTKRVKLTLQYFWYNINISNKIVLTNNDDLNVSIQVMPFYTLPAPGE